MDALQVLRGRHAGIEHRHARGRVAGAVDIAAIADDEQHAAAPGAEAVIRWLDEPGGHLGPGFIQVHVVDVVLGRIVQRRGGVGHDHHVIADTGDGARVFRRTQTVDVVRVPGRAAVNRMDDVGRRAWRAAGGLADGIDAIAARGLKERVGTGRAVADRHVQHLVGHDAGRGLGQRQRQDLKDLLAGQVGRFVDAGPLIGAQRREVLGAPGGDGRLVEHQRLGEFVERGRVGRRAIVYLYVRLAAALGDGQQGAGDIRRIPPRQGQRRPLLRRFDGIGLIELVVLCR